jgi:hypothetical protein
LILRFAGLAGQTLKPNASVDLEKRFLLDTRPDLRAEGGNHAMARIPGGRHRRAINVLIETPVAKTG